VRGTVGLLPLLDGVLARGRGPGSWPPAGISTAAGVRAVLAAGASAARVGTAFVVAFELRAPPGVCFRAAWIGRPEDTECTTVFSQRNGPTRPHRVLRSAITPPTPSDGDVAGANGREGRPPRPVPRYSISPPTLTTTGADQRHGPLTPAKARPP